MAEENNQNWNKKKVLMILIGAVVLGTAAALQDTTQQFIKDFFSPAAAPETKNTPQIKEKPLFQIGNDAQGLQFGDGNTQNNTKYETHNYGVSDEKHEKLVKELGITEAALKNLFKILELQNVPPEELDNALRKLAEKHKELEKRAALLESDDPEVNKLQKQAHEAIDKAEYETAEDLLDQAVKLDNDAADKVHEVYLKRKRSAAETLALKAKTLHTRFNLTEAVNAYEQAIQYAQQGEDEVTAAEYRNSLGRVFHDNGKYQQAIDQFELALASAIKTYGEDHPIVARDRNNLGEAWRNLGQYQKAIDYLELALASDLKTYGEDHPSVALYRNNLGIAWNRLGQYQKAIDYFELALASDLKIYGENHPNVAMDRNNLGAGWDDLGQYQKAIDYYELALASDLRTNGENHPNVALYRNNLGTAWSSLGQYQKAIDYFEKALSIAVERLGADHTNTLLVKNNLENARQALLSSNHPQ